MAQLPGTPAAELGAALRVGAELLEVQGQSVAGWHGQCTLQLLQQVLKSLRLATHLAVTIYTDAFVI